MSADDAAAVALLARAVEALEAIAGALVVVVGGDSAPCAHPAADRVDQGSTMGHPRWVCRVCGYEVTS